MLPSNVCVEETQVGARVYLADPGKMMAASGFDDTPELRELGAQASRRLARAAAAIAKFSK